MNFVSQWFNMLLYTTPKYSPEWEFYNINIKGCTWKTAHFLANNFVSQCAVRLSREQTLTLALHISVVKLKYCMLFLQFQTSPMTLLQHVLLAISSWLSISYMGDCTWAQGPTMIIQNLYLFSKWERLIVSAVISMTNLWTYHCLYPTDVLLSCTSISNHCLLYLIFSHVSSSIHFPGAQCVFVDILSRLYCEYSSSDSQDSWYYYTAMVIVQCSQMFCVA